MKIYILATLILLGVETSFSQDEEYTIKQTNINHNGVSLGVSFYNNGLVFSQKEIESFNKREVAVFNIKYASKIENTIFDIPNTDEFKNMNISFSNGSPSFYKDEIYFTTNTSKKLDYVDKKPSKNKINKKGVNTLQILKSIKSNDKWSTSVPLQFSSIEHSCTHPFVTVDGETLYFSSNMPGGYGGFDIYLCKRNSQGGWSAPLNLGDKVNSLQDEMFPSFYFGKLYFSSKKNLIKGADIFASEFINSEWESPKNIKYLNSNKDDFGIIFIDEFSGYFCSNREMDSTIDNTYYFEAKFNGSKYKTSIADIYTRYGLEGVIATLSNENMSGKKQFKTDENGNITLIIPEGKSTYLFEKEGYISQTITINGEQDADKLKNVKLLANFNGIIKNDINGRPIKGMIVRAYDPETGELIAETTTNENGEWGLPLDKSKTYDFSFDKEGYGKTLKKGISFSDREKIENLLLIPKVNGISSNFITGELEPGVLVQAIDPLTNEVYDEMVTGEDGRWGFELPEDRDFLIRFKKDGFKKEDILLKGGDRGSSMKDKFGNIKIKPDAKKGNKLEIRNIYFEFNRASVKKDSYQTLDNIVAFMKEDPKIRIELSAHTDMVGKDKYNQRLSEKRAEAAVEYLIKKGIKSSRLEAKGYGEQYILNRCTSYSAKCSEEENAINRRVEIKIL
jgi:outer membrane protein OmpA-like peptidoglycan-associated protein